MKGVVLDASVVAAAFFNEEHTEEARALLTGEQELLAPDLLHAEVANVIWKRCGRGEMDAQEATRLLADVLSLPLDVTPSADLAETALELALRTGRTVYDCIYLTLAISADAELITVDRRMANALANSPLARHVRWIGDRPSAGGKRG